MFIDKVIYNMKLKEEEKTYVILICDIDVLMTQRLESQIDY